jgi:hypothetical protein
MITVALLAAWLRVAPVDLYLVASRAVERSVAR